MTVEERVLLGRYMFWADDASKVAESLGFGVENTMIAWPLHLDARCNLGYDIQGPVPSELCGRHDCLATAPRCLAPLVFQVDVMRHLVARAEDRAAV